MVRLPPSERRAVDGDFVASRSGMLNRRNGRRRLSSRHLTGHRERGYMRCDRALTLDRMASASVHVRKSDLPLVSVQVVEWMVR